MLAQHAADRLDAETRSLRAVMENRAPSRWAAVTTSAVVGAVRAEHDRAGGTAGHGWRCAPGPNPAVADPDVGRRARSDGSDLTEEVLFAGQILRLPDRTRPVQRPQFG